jgi:hypothetical protein
MVVRAQLIAAISYGCLLCTSFAFLSCGVVTIQRFVKSHAQGAHVDIKAVRLHVLAQAFYLIGRLLLLVSGCIFYVNGMSYVGLTGKLTIYALITNCFTSLAGEALLLRIMMRMSAVKPRAAQSLQTKPVPLHRRTTIDGFDDVVFTTERKLTTQHSIDTVSIQSPEDKRQTEIDMSFLDSTNTDLFKQFLISS